MATIFHPLGLLGKSASFGWPVIVGSAQDGAGAAMSDALDGPHNRGVTAARPTIKPVPDQALLGPGVAGNADVEVNVVQGYAGTPELQYLAGGVHPRDTLLEPLAGADVTED